MMNLSPFLLFLLEWVYGNVVLCSVFLLGPNGSHGLEPGDVVREQDEDQSPSCEQDPHQSMIGKPEQFFIQLPL